MNLSEMAQFNFLDFWTKGGFTFSFDDSQVLKNLENFVVHKEKLNREYNGEIPVDVAHWDTDWTAKEDPPQVYSEALNTILKSEMIKSYCQIYGKFTTTKIMFHRTPKTYVNDYHTHTYDGAHMHIFLYLAPEERDVEDGGLIEVGEVVDKKNVLFDPVGFYQKNPKVCATNISEIVRTGLCIVCNNLNPYFRHRITELYTDKPRYTVMLALGYTDNCIANQHIPHI